MRRFYAHYTFIFPDIYLKNVVVELDSKNAISNISPYEKEIENTEFHSGWIYFIPQKEKCSNMSTIDEKKHFQSVHHLSIDKIEKNPCNVFNAEGLKIS